MYCIKHIQNSGIFRTLFIHIYSDIFQHIQAYSALLSYTHRYWSIVKAYSGLFRHIQHLRKPHIFKTLPYSQPWHIQKSVKLWPDIQNPVIVRHHSAIFRHSEPLVTLAYAEIWHIWNSEIFRTLSYLYSNTYSDLFHIYKNFFSSVLYLRSLTGFWICSSFNKFWITCRVTLEYVSYETFRTLSIIINSDIFRHIQNCRNLAYLGSWTI